MYCHLDLSKQNSVDNAVWSCVYSFDEYFVFCVNEQQCDEICCITYLKLLFFLFLKIKICIFAKRTYPETGFVVSAG